MSKRKQYFYNKAFETMVDEIDFFSEMLHEDKSIGELVLTEVVRDCGGDMWCDVQGFFVSSGDCGSSGCADYEPCNGVSGRCRYLKNGFKDSGRVFVLKEEGLTEVENVGKV